VRDRLAKLTQDKGDLLSLMDEIDRALTVERSAMMAAEARIKEKEQEIETLKGNLASTEMILAQRRSQLEPRLVVRYKMGELGVLPALFSAQSLSELAMRRRMLGRILRDDTRQISEVNSLLERQRLSRAKLILERESLGSLQRAAANRIKRLRVAQQEREGALELLQEEAGLKQAMLRQLNEAESALGGMVAGLGRRSKQAVGFAREHHQLPWPAEGKVMQGFGAKSDPRYETVTVNKGIDIRVPKGAPVFAVAPGQVVHSGWLRGYGNLLIIDHGDAYFSLMAHLDQMLVSLGDTVKGSELVARAGDSASLKGAYLYFEIRHRGEALDPARWLRPR